MFHLSAFTALLGTTADTDITALQDDILAIQNNHFLPQVDLSVVKLWVASATLSRVKLNSPKIRQINPTFIRPINVGTLPANNPNYSHFDGSQLVVKAQEELQMLATSGIAMGTERFTGLVWLSTGINPIPTGDIYTCRFTSTGTAGANAWTTISYTMDTILPQGLYSMVSSELQSTNALAHRWIFSNQYWRPGGLSLTSLGNRSDFDLYDFEQGEYGRFATFDLPRLQVLCNGADAAHEGYFTVVRVGPAPATPYTPMQ